MNGFYLKKVIKKEKQKTNNNNESQILISGQLETDILLILIKGNEG